MSVLKYYNTNTSTWDPASLGDQGATGATGPSGATGPTGATGIAGATGPGSGGIVNYPAQASDLTLPTTVGGNNVAITPTADITVTLPSASALTLANFMLKNLSQTYTLIVNDNAGNYLLAIGPDTGYYMWAIDVSTAAGVWTTGNFPSDIVNSAPSITSIQGITKGNMYPGGGTQISAISSTQAVYVFNLLKATTGSYSGTTTIYAAVVTNNSGVLTMSTPVFVSGSMYYSGGKNATIQMLSSTTGIIAWNSGQNTPNSISAVPITVSGTTITVGTESIAILSTNANNYYVYNPSIAMLTATTALIMATGVYGSGTQYALVATISGSTLTYGAINNGLTTYGSTAAWGGQCVSLSSTLVAFVYSPASGTEIAVGLYSISGTTTTYVNSLTINSANYAISAQITALSATKFIVSYYANSAGALYAMTCSVSGFTITAGNELFIDSGGSYYAPSISAISATQALLFSNNYTPYPTSYYLTISGTTTTKSNTTIVNSSQIFYGIVGSCAMQAPAVATPSASTCIYAYNSGYVGNAGSSAANVITGGNSSVGTAYPLWVGSQVGSSAIFNSTYMVPTFVSISPTQAILLYQPNIDPTLSAVPLVAKLITITGTSYAVTSSINFGITTANSPTWYKMAICALSSTQCVIAYGTTTNGYTVTLNISGSTLTIGTPVITLAGNMTYGISIAATSSTSAVVAGFGGSAYVNTITVSGTAITAGTQTSFSTGTAGRGNIVALTATTGIIFATNGSSNYMYAIGFSVSGGTWTFQLPTVYGPLILNSSAAMTYGGNFYAVAVSSTRAIAVSAGAGTVGMFCVDLANLVPTFASTNFSVNAFSTSPQGGNNLAILSPLSASKGFVFVGTWDAINATYLSAGYIAPYTIVNGTPIIGKPLTTNITSALAIVATPLVTPNPVAFPTASKAALMYSNTATGSSMQNNELYEGRVYFSQGAIV
jgi:hypothetical protein